MFRLFSVSRASLNSQAIQNNDMDDDEIEILSLGILSFVCHCFDFASDSNPTETTVIAEEEEEFNESFLCSSLKLPAKLCMNKCSIEDQNIKIRVLTRAWRHICYIN